MSCPAYRPSCGCLRGSRASFAGSRLASVGDTSLQHLQSSPSASGTFVACRIAHYDLLLAIHVRAFHEHDFLLNFRMH